MLDTDAEKFVLTASGVNPLPFAVIVADKEPIIAGCRRILPNCRSLVLIVPLYSVSAGFVKFANLPVIDASPSEVRIYIFVFSTPELPFIVPCTEISLGKLTGWLFN